VAPQAQVSVAAHTLAVLRDQRCLVELRGLVSVLVGGGTRGCAAVVGRLVVASAGMWQQFQVAAELLTPAEALPAPRRVSSALVPHCPGPKSLITTSSATDSITSRTSPIARELPQPRPSGVGG